jgi:predicted DsbA family dithiol-disulfide isomerase
MTSNGPAARHGTVLVYADIGCPWAHAAIYRLHAARARHGREEAVSFDIRAFPLELFNEAPTPRRALDAEIPVVGTMEPGAGWATWSGPAETYPVTMLPAMEAVAAAKEQSLHVSDRLDRALRIAFFRDSRCVSMHHEILDVAGDVQGLDVKALDAALVAGTHRSTIFRDQEAARRLEVQGSPHLFLPNGSGMHNPGVKMHWEGPKVGGYPVVDQDDPSVYDDIIRRATEDQGG